MPCLSLVFLFFFLPLDLSAPADTAASPSGWTPTRRILICMWVCVCVFLQAIEAGGRRIPLRSQPKGIQSAIPDRSGEILLFRDNSRMTLVFGVCEMVSHHRTVNKRKKKIPLALWVKEIFFADSQVVFRHRLLFFHRVSWHRECKENNQELKRKWTNESLPSFTNHKTYPSRQNSHLSHFSSGFCPLLGHVTYSKPVSQAHPSTRNGITNFWTFSGRINAPGVSVRKARGTFPLAVLTSGRPEVSSR